MCIRDRYTCTEENEKISSYLPSFYTVCPQKLDYDAVTMLFTAYECFTTCFKAPFLKWSNIYLRWTIQNKQAWKYMLGKIQFYRDHYQLQNTELLFRKMTNLDKKLPKMPWMWNLWTKNANYSNTVHTTYHLEVCYLKIENKF